MNVGAELLLSLAVFLPLALGAAAGVLVLRDGTGRWLPLARWPRGRWSGSEVLLCFLLYLIVPVILLSGLDATPFFFFIFQEHVSGLRQSNVITPLAVVLLFALHITVVLHFLSGARPGQVGLTLVRWRQNVRLGLVSFCLITPLVYAIFALARLLTTQVPHGFEQLAKENLYAWEWVLMAFNALVAAPLLEEWLFRGLLLNWLRCAWPAGHVVVAAAALWIGSAPLFQSIAAQADDPAAKLLIQHGLDPNDLELRDALDFPPPPPMLWESLLFSLVVVGIYIAGVLRLWWPVFQRGLGHFVEHAHTAGALPLLALAPIEGQTPVIVPQGPRWETFKLTNARWAIFGSALLFAQMHAPAWPSPLPLLPLGLVLGWLAFRTQSLVPSIVLHALFNAVAWATLYVDTMYLKAL